MSEKPTIRKRTNKTPKKLCVKCGKVLPLNDFYRNREWSAQSYRDAWCKKCVNDFCTTRESLREYCWYSRFCSQASFESLRCQRSPPG